jgi:hypothetical protein
LLDKLKENKTKDRRHTNNKTKNPNIDGTQTKKEVN